MVKGLKICSLKSKFRNYLRQLSFCSVLITNTVNRINKLFSILYYLITLTSFTYFIATQSARFILI